MFWWRKFIDKLTSLLRRGIFVTAIAQQMTIVYGLLWLENYADSFIEGAEAT